MTTWADATTTNAVGPTIVVLALFGALCAAIAGSKGRSRLEYFIFGFILPPIGLIVALLLKPFPPAQPPAPRPPNWYPDPWGHARLRYYDGARWTYWTDPPTHLNQPQSIPPR